MNEKEKPVEQSPQPAFPAIHVQFAPDRQGVIVHILFGPHTSLSQMIDAPSMDDLARKWLAARKEARTQHENELAVVRHLRHTKSKKG